MKVIAAIASFGDNSTSGASIMNMWLLRALKAHGHEVEIWVPTRIVNADDCPDFPVLHYVQGLRERRYYDADVVLTSPDVVGRIGAKIMRHTGLPGVAIVHNVSENNQKYYERYNWDLTIWGSGATQKSFDSTQGIVVYPPLDVKANRPGRSVPKFNTAVNLSHLKGGETFWEIVKQMPKHKFLGVRSWGQQVELEGFTNAVVEDAVPHSNVKELWKKTRVLLVPSLHESWGMAASEAMAAGRPVIAHPNEGLKENLGDAGMWAHRGYPEEYVSLILMLDDPVVYKEWSIRSYERALEIEKQSKIGLELFVNTMEERYL